MQLLSAESYDAHVPGLAEVLADAVTGGASVGFRLPFTVADAAAWWATRAPAVRAGELRVWVAGSGAGGVAGTVSLALPVRPNGRHRAEVLKLMVHRDHRGKGLGRALLGTAEAAAAASGATLLLLDTVTGSPAERLYSSAGWTRFGVVPGYASDPAGTLEDCSFFYKQR